MRLALLSAYAASIKAGFRQDQLRDAAGCWTRECVVERGNDKTGYPRIDATTDLIIGVVRDAMERIGPGSGPLYGTRIHSEVPKTIRSLDLPGIGREGVEQSFVDGEIALYGSLGSIRTGIIKKKSRSSADDVLAIWDLKTGGAHVTRSRAAQIREKVGVDESVPVIEIHVLDGISIRSWISRANLHMNMVDGAQQ